MTASPSRSGPCRVLLVDDHEIVRRGVRTILSGQAGIEVVGEAGTVAGAVEATARLRPDVVVLDLRLPDGSGVEACRRIREQQPGVGVLMLTSYADEDALFAAVMAGAAGYVLKDLDPTQLRDAILTVGSGGSLLNPSMTTALLERVRSGALNHPADDAFAQLTPQEERILDMIADGDTNRQIAVRLSLSEKTIKNYVSQIYAKLNIERRSQAATIATERRMRKYE